MDNSNEVTESFDKINLTKGETLSQCTISEEDYFRSSQSIENETEYQIKIKPKLPFPSKNKFTKNDFEILGLIGRGAYARVVKARLIKNDMIYAIKIIEKDFIEKEKKLYQIYLENEILGQLNHDNIIKIFGIFEENGKIYIVLEYCEKGDFFDFLKLNTPLPYETAKYFAAQIVNSLQYLHNLNTAHRDLKPENIMIDHKLHLKIIDFATAKIKNKLFDKLGMKFVDNKTDMLQKRNTFVGTAEYVSPEVLNDLNVGPETDLWALGCIIYQMFTGQSPFKDKTDYLTFRKILNNTITIPPDIPEDAANIIKSLLVKDPLQRLGSGEDGSNNDFESLKNHPFFKGVEFDKLSLIEVPNKETLNFKVFFKENKVKKEEKTVILDKTNKKGEFKVIKEGVVKKKSPWFHYNTRKLILDNTPKLEYLEMTKNYVKGVIYLTKECQALFIDLDRFELNTPKRIFVFKTEANDASSWVKLINDSIKN